MVYTKLTAVAAIRGEQKLWLPGFVRRNKEVFSLADSFRYEQIRETYRGGL